MEKILMLLAVAFFVAAIISGSITTNTWKNTALTWAFLVAGITVFGIVLTL